jgi:hypothetical protein
MQQIGNKKVIHRRTREIICNTFDYMRITFSLEPLTKIGFLRIYFFSLFSDYLATFLFTACMRNLTLTIQFCDISQSFVSATKYENTSKTRTFDQGPITPFQIQNKNKRAPTIYTCKRPPVRGQESRLVRARPQFETQQRSFPRWSYVHES